MFFNLTPLHLNITIWSSHSRVHQSDWHSLGLLFNFLNCLLPQWVGQIAFSVTFFHAQIKKSECVWWWGVIFWYTFWNKFLFFIVPLETVSFCLIQRATVPCIGKSPCRPLMAALTFGKAWLLFLLELLQLSSVLIIEKIWKIEDLILVQAFYTCSHIFTWKRCSSSPWGRYQCVCPSPLYVYAELTFEGSKPFILFGTFVFSAPSIAGIVCCLSPLSSL